MKCSVRTATHRKEENGIKDQDRHPLRSLAKINPGEIISKMQVHGAQSAKTKQAHEQSMLDHHHYVRLFGGAGDCARNRAKN
jgi:hypothetical protein